LDIQSFNKLLQQKEKQMTKREQKILMEILKQTIIDTDKMFNENVESKDYIIGYLQGAIKTAVRELEE
jgi:hypothetical protein